MTGRTVIPLILLAAGIVVFGSLFFMIFLRDIRATRACGAPLRATCGMTLMAASILFAVFCYCDLVCRMVQGAGGDL